MKFSKASALTLTVALAAALPQGGLPAGLSDLPQCGYPALLQVVQSSGCDIDDTQCLCSKPDLESTLNSIVESECPESDRPAVLQFALSTCPSDTASSSAPASTSSPAPTDAPVNGAAMTSTTTPVSASTSLATTDSTTGTMSTYPTATGGSSPNNGTNGTTTPTYNSPTPESSMPVSEGGAQNVGVSLFAFAVAVGGMSWVFAEF